MAEQTPEGEPLWYKDAIIYELPLKSFYDSNGDGIGDFAGLKEKLGYLEDLGITALWLLPFYPSPLKDDGYDISDYMNIHPDYGTLRDFRDFLREAHRRGIRVITELVLNHTSDQHPLFQRSRRAPPGSVLREFYLWSDNPYKFKEARIIFQDFETSNWTWDPVGGAYYWHRFYSHQPDLNFDSPLVRKMIFRAVDFWLEMGVDGLRLDAVPYLFEREGTNCENLPETYVFLKELRAHVDGKFQDRMLLAEANQWPEDAVAYFGRGDICHMAFHFPLMPRIFLGLRTEDRFPIVDIMAQTPAIPETCQWALFLRNHDELTLEMVTDEERDYMYRVYARDPHARINLGIRRRLAPLMENSRRRIELLNILLFFLPGTPVLYYGDEIGMGDDYYLGDRNGVRTPMQWSPDRNAGFSQANPQKLYMPVIIDPEYHYIAVNVETQERNASSLLWWMKRAISWRKRFKAPGRGGLEFLFPENSKVLAFIRNFQEETILVVANLSRFFQVAELDLSRYTGRVPQEVSSQKDFPIIRDGRYVLTIGPHEYLLLSLRKAEERAHIGERMSLLPEIHETDRWESVLTHESREKLEEEVLPRFLMRSRWFGGKGAVIRKVSLVEIIPLPKNADGEISYLLFLEVTYTERPQDLYLLPVSFTLAKNPDGSVDESLRDCLRTASVSSDGSSENILARLSVGDREGILFDGTCDGRFREVLLSVIARRRRLKGERGEIVSRRGEAFRHLLGGKTLPLTSQRVKAEQSNTSILYEDRFYFKLFRNLKEGINPEQEVIQFLTEKAGFAHVPAFAGNLEYQRAGAEPMTVGLLQAFVPNQGDAWAYTQDTLGRYFERGLSRVKDFPEIPKTPPSLLDVNPAQVPSSLQELMEGNYLEMTALLGKRTAEMHRALASLPEEKAFAPEPFSILYQRSVFQSMRTQLGRVFGEVRSNLSQLPEKIRGEAEAILQSQQRILAVMQRFARKKFAAQRIRIHGDYHLGQVLFTGKDFLIIDFEGEPARSMTERRLKISPFRDVAGMIRSFHYAAFTALFKAASVRPEDTLILEPWAKLWYGIVSGVFLRSYLDTVGKDSFLPPDREELETMLTVFLLDKAVYELGYELNHRPDWMMTPIRGIKDLLEVP